MSKLPKIFAFVVFSCCSMFAQQPNQFPPGTIDGAVNPELIPDVVAFRLFFTAVAGNMSAPSLAMTNSSSSSSAVTATPAQKAKLLPIQLSDADSGVFIQALPAFSANLLKATAANAAAPAATTSTSNGQTTQRSLDDIAQDTVNTMKAQMTPDGFQRLLAFVQSQKKYIKRVPYPAMGSH